MLGQETDVWNMHRPADWNFINKNYKAIVIGVSRATGQAFQPFLGRLRRRVQTADYRLGNRNLHHRWARARSHLMCDVEAVNAVFTRALMVNVRDEVTAKLYGEAMAGAISITPCPTISYLRAFEVKPVA